MPLTALWEDRHPRSVEPEPAPVSGEWDVVIVGAGITGLTLAGLLARGGKQVLVLEARRIGAGTTGRSTAKVSLLQGTHYSRISRRHGDAVLRDYATANAEGQAWVTRFCDDHGVDHQRRPAYTYATTTSGEQSVRSELKALETAGVVGAEWVDEVDLPFPVHGAVRLADQVQVDPLELVLALHADATAHGATVVEGARVTGVTGQAPYSVVTEGGTATTARVVIATNLPILDRGAFFARAEPARSYSIAFRTPGPAIDGMYLSADSPTRSLRDAPAGPDGGSVLLVGGDGHKTGGATSETSHLESIREWTREHYPDAEETHAWSAQDYMPHHALPYAGPILPGTDGILVAGGFSKWGMTNGPAAALALSARILGGRVDWASAYEPWTTHELSGLPESLRLNATVALEMATGWVRRLTSQDGARVCTHLGGITRWNDAENSWDCPLHGSRFGPDGEVIDGPAVCGLSR